VNLRLYLRVLRRFWFVVLVGFVLACVLAFATLAKVNFSHGVKLSYRQHPTWQSTTQLFVTQQGFPWGRLVLPSGSTTTKSSSGTSQFADPNRLVGLAVLYAQLINSDPIQRQIARIVPQGDALSALAVRDPGTGTPLPLVAVIAVGHTATEAARVSRAGANVFRSYIAGQERSAGIPVNQRVELQVISTKASLVSGRKKTMAILAFLATMIATIGLTLALENLRPGTYVHEPAAPRRTLPERNVA
jgi:hypothetical protein